MRPRREPVGERGHSTEGGTAYGARVTFSIVGRSADGSCLGVAVASKFLAVGAVVPGADPAAGAVATQALANLAYVPEALRHMAEGRDAASTVAALVDSDAGRDDRQVGVVDRRGGSATYTGAACLPWAGGVTAEGVAIQGNILAGPEVVSAMLEAWQASNPELPLARRLLAALGAGDRAGGDRRGRQSAAVLVVTPGGGYGGGSDVLVDLRVDDHADPVPELVRLLDIHDLLFGRPDPDDCLPLDGPAGEQLAVVLARLGYDHADVERSLAVVAGIENLEERLVPGRVDPVVLAYLEQLAEGRDARD